MVLVALFLFESRSYRERMASQADFVLPGTSRIGAVGLRVGSIAKVAPFYREVVGLAGSRSGDQVRLGTSEDILILEEAPDAPARGQDQAGLFHVAVRVPSRAALADALGRIRDSDFSLTGASDHVVSEALYLRDPEGNGLEIYRDRPREEWPWTDDGGVAMETLPLDLDSLGEHASGSARAPDGTDIGHVHLEVTDLAAAEAFYVDTLGMNVRARYGEAATFVAAGDYHHHFGLNTWNGRTAPVSDSRGIAWIEFVIPDQATLTTLRERIPANDTLEQDSVVTDPDGIALRFTTA